MFCVNVEIIKTVINNYSKNIVDWLDSVKKDNNVNINTIRTMITDSIQYANNEISELIKNGDYQGTINQQAMLLVMMGSLNVLDNGIEQLKQYLLFDDKSIMQIAINAIDDVDMLFNNSYRLIGLNKYTNNLYIQNIYSEEYIKCDGIINYTNDIIINKFLLNSATVINKKDINVTDICLDKILYISDLKKNNGDIFTIHNGGKRHIFDDNGCYVKKYTNLSINLPKEWINVEKLNSEHDTYIINESLLCDDIKKKFNNPLILNTFGINILPDIIFADIIILNEFMYTKNEIKQRLYKKSNVIELKNELV